MKFVYDVIKFMQLDIFIIPYIIPSLFFVVNEFNFLIRHSLKILDKFLFIQIRMFFAGKGVYQYIDFFCGCEAESFFTFYRTNHRVSFIRENLFEVLPELVSVMDLQFHFNLARCCRLNLFFDFLAGISPGERFSGVQVRLNRLRSPLKLLFQIVRCS